MDDFADANMTDGDDLQVWHDDSLNPEQHYVYINGDITIICHNAKDADTIFLALQKAKTIRIED